MHKSRKNSIMNLSVPHESPSFNKCQWKANLILSTIPPTFSQPQIILKQPPDIISFHPWTLQNASLKQRTIIILQLKIKNNKIKNFVRTTIPVSYLLKVYNNTQYYQISSQCSKVLMSHKCFLKVVFCWDHHPLLNSFIRQIQN